MTGRAGARAGVLGAVGAGTAWCAAGGVGFTLEGCWADFGRLLAAGSVVAMIPAKINSAGNENLLQPIDGKTAQELGIEVRGLLGHDLTRKGDFF